MIRDAEVAGIMICWWSLQKKKKPLCTTKDAGDFPLKRTKSFTLLLRFIPKIPDTTAPEDITRAPKTIKTSPGRLKKIRILKIIPNNRQSDRWFWKYFRTAKQARCLFMEILELSGDDYFQPCFNWRSWYQLWYRVWLMFTCVIHLWPGIIRTSDYLIRPQITISKLI